MIKEEAYQKMSEGYMVTHKLFDPNEYLYMDESFIIRSQDGEVFENDWDVRTSTEWNIDWYIYKGKFNKNRKDIPEIVKKQKLNPTALPMYDMETGRIEQVEGNNEQLLLSQESENITFEGPLYEDNGFIEHKKLEAEWIDNIQPKSRIKRLILRVLYFFIERIK